MNEGVIALAPARFSIGGVLADSLRIFGRNFVNFGAVAMVLQLPWLLAPLIGDATRISESADFDWSNEVFKPLVGLICAGFTQAAIILGVGQNLRGRQATMNDAVRGLPFAVPIIFATVICYLPSFVPAIVEHGLRAHALVIGAASLVFGVLYFVLLVICWILSCNCDRKDRSYCGIGAQYGTQQGPSLDDLRSPAHSGRRASLYYGSCLGVRGR